MRSSYPGEILPSQLSPCARVKHADIPIWNLEFGTAEALQRLLIPIQDRAIVIGRLVLGVHETFNSGGASATIKIGTRITSTQVVEAILAAFNIGTTKAIGTSIIKEAVNMAATLKTSNSEWPGYPIVPKGYAVEIIATANGTSGNAGMVKGFLEWWYRDDVNPA